MTEIIFEVTEDEVDGGYSASALGHGIHTQGDSLKEIRSNVKEAVDCYFDDAIPRPKLIRLHSVRDEVLVAWGFPQR
ncbi:MAG: 2-oxoisovalerate dehydrogenase [Acidobacteria bacterium]|nr:2-oxoisovalerate dehydrogenase [Acidobacteriota bacterium]